MKRALVVLACVVGAVIAAVGLLAGFGMLHAYRLTGSAREPTRHCAGPGAACLGDHADRVVAVRYTLSSPASGCCTRTGSPARRWSRRCTARGRGRPASATTPTAWL